MICAKCGLANCACRSGKTRITVGADTPEEAKTVAMGYLSRRGYDGELLGLRRRQHVKTGIAGYKAWELVYRVTRT